MGNMEKLYQIKNISFAYDEKDVIKDISLDIEISEFVGIIGPNGSGKTTLLRLLNKILKEKKGKIYYKGQSLNKVEQTQISKEVGFVPQETFINFPFTVSEIVMMGRYPYIGMLGFEGKKDIEIVKQCLEITDLKDMGERLYVDLSGGEKKRVIIARALAQEPESLLLDEPTSALDIRYEIEVYNLLRRLNQNKKITIIIVTHNINFASLYCSRLVLMRDGSIFGIGNAVDIIKPEIIKDVYGIDVKINYDNETRAPYLLPKTIREDTNDILLFERPSTS
jgi:iron complex transport system ATP-binding protein